MSDEAKGRRTSEDQDWTGGDGRSNNSELYLKLVEEVAGIIGNCRVGDHPSTSARVIVSRMAHIHGLAPRPNSPQARGFRDAEHEEASRAAWGIPDPSDIVTTEPPVEAGWLGAEPVSTSATSRKCDACERSAKEGHKCADHQDPDAPPSDAKDGTPCDVWLVVGSQNLRAFRTQHEAQSAWETFTPSMRREYFVSGPYNPGRSPDYDQDAREAKRLAALRRDADRSPPSDYPIPLTVEKNGHVRGGGVEERILLRIEVPIGHAQRAIDAIEALARPAPKRTPTSEMTPEEIVYARGLGQLVVDKYGLGSVPSDWLEQWRKTTPKRSDPHG